MRCACSSPSICFASAISSASRCDWSSLTPLTASSTLLAKPATCWSRALLSRSTSSRVSRIALPRSDVSRLLFSSMSCRRWWSRRSENSSAKAARSLRSCFMFALRNSMLSARSLFSRVRRSPSTAAASWRSMVTRLHLVKPSSRKAISSVIMRASFETSTSRVCDSSSQRREQSCMERDVVCSTSPRRRLSSSQDLRRASSIFESSASSEERSVCSSWMLSTTTVNWCVSSLNAECRASLSASMEVSSSFHRLPPTVISEARSRASAARPARSSFIAAARSASAARRFRCSTAAACLESRRSRRSSATSVTARSPLSPKDF
mmetsp:Transcript_73314/g.203377  ORF Transcript_73314/g.203377 Transcript_73314/m.203377 type:complete len:322 (+) Transcript_73314:625-1590(+)